MPNIAAADIRETVLNVIHEMQPKGALDSPLQQSSVLDVVAKRLITTRNEETERAVLALWHDLFRTGHLAWGINFSNPNPPFFHITDRGRRALERLSRDPGNPAGYLAHLHSISIPNAIALSYLKEGLECFSAGLHKAAAVMLGAAAESVILEIRGVVRDRLSATGSIVPKRLEDWRVKTVNDALYEILYARVSKMPHELQSEFESLWPAFTQQIRSTRNDAGHPSSIDPVEPDAVHASFLVFPEIARTATRLLKWIPENL